MRKKNKKFKKKLCNQKICLLKKMLTKNKLGQNKYLVSFCKPKLKGVDSVRYYNTSENPCSIPDKLIFQLVAVSHGN